MSNDPAESGTAGGAAASSGTEFQHRILALIMAGMLKGFDPFESICWLSLGVPKEVFPESGDATDDLRIHYAANTIVYIQAKTSLSFSLGDNSEMVSAFSQFVTQYVMATGNPIRLILATPSTSSRRITKELRKILNSIRENPLGYKTNPLNKSEREVLDGVTKLGVTLLQKAMNRPIAEPDITALLTCIYVAVLDIEADLPLEKATMVRIAEGARVSALVIWSVVLQKAVWLTSNRISICQASIIDQLAFYYGATVSKDDTGGSILGPELVNAKDYPALRDYLLCESPFEPDAFIIMWMQRFGDDCTRRYHYPSDEHVEFGPPEETQVWKVLARSGSQEGIDLYITSNLELFRSKKVVILESAKDPSSAARICAKAHAEACIHQFQFNPAWARCARCGNPVLEDDSLFCEIDNDTQPFDVRLLHRRCVRPADRFIGRLSAPDSGFETTLKGFDYRLWADLAARGQGGLRGLSNLVSRGNAVIAWNDDLKPTAQQMYCVEITLDSGVTTYATERGRLQRYHRNEAERFAAQFNQQATETKTSGNPICYGSELSCFGSLNDISAILQPGELAVSVKSAQAVRYSPQLDSANRDYENHYAPLILVWDLDADDYWVMQDRYVVFISAPLAFHHHLSNWRVAGIAPDKYETRIVPSDEEFDRIMNDIIQRGLGAALDPLLKPSGERLSGLPIAPLSELKKSAESKMEE